MPKVISFINRKGGTGKTTSAINVASSLTQMGFPTVLIETDNNYTVGELRKLEVNSDVVGNDYAAKKPGRNFDILQADWSSAGSAIDNLKKSSIEMIVVDGAANMPSSAAVAIASRSDMIVIPLNLSESEIMVTEKTLQDLAPVIAKKPELKVLLLANRIHFLTAPETIANKLSSLDAPLLDVYVPQFKLYQMLSTMTPAGTYRKVTKRIVQYLQHKGKIQRPRELTV